MKIRRIFSGQGIGTAVVRLLLLAACLLSGAMSSRAREARGGKWEPQERAATAMEFFNRMVEEFQARAKRLKEETGTAPDVACPFLESATSDGKKAAKEWDEFIEGKMGEAGTTRWIGKGLKELESVRKKLAAAEKPAKGAWDKKFKDGRKPVELPKEMEAFIYDIQVQAKNLGVILDNSPSMRPALPAVRAEISARFTGARYVEVDGCQIEAHSKHWGLFPLWYYSTVLEHRNPFDPKWFLPAIPQNDIHYQMIEWQRNALAALEAMIVNMKVDAIYWFCDFDDDVQLAVIQKLGELIEKNKVRLYVHTVKSNPPPALGNIIKRSGGKMTRADPASGRAAAEQASAPGAAPATVKPVTAPARDLRFPPITLNDGEVIVHEGKNVQFEAVVKKVSKFGPQGHLRLEFEEVSLYAACRAENLETVFQTRDPFTKIQPGDKVTIRGRITVLQGGHTLILENKDQFFLTQTVRDVPGTGGAVKEVEKSIRVEIPAAK